MESVLLYGTNADMVHFLKKGCVMVDIYKVSEKIQDKADRGAAGVVAFCFSRNGVVDVLYGSQNQSASHEQMIWYLEEASNALEALIQKEELAEY